MVVGFFSLFQIFPYKSESQQNLPIVFNVNLILSHTPSLTCVNTIEEQTFALDSALLLGLRSLLHSLILCIPQTA